MSPIEYFRVIAKQFASVDDATVNVWLTIAALNAPNCLIGDSANLAQAYYAAHLLYLDAEAANGAGGRGNIKSEREGDLSRTYGTISGDDTWLGSSPYGQQYVNMTLGCAGAGIMTRFGSGPFPTAAPWADDVMITGQPRNLY